MTYKESLATHSHIGILHSSDAADKDLKQQSPGSCVDEGDEDVDGLMDEDCGDAVGASDVAEPEANENII